MTQPDNPGLRKKVRDYLAAHEDDALSWIETHGLVCAEACGPAAPDGWQQLVRDEARVDDDISEALTALRDRLRAQLGLGEQIQLPCRLDPYEDNEGNDLTSWCIGFITAVSANEAAWHAQESDQVFDMLLPFVLISGMDEDPELDQLWQDTKLVRQMAMSIPDLLEEIFLFFHAPEVSNDTSEQADD